jgi:hypothetical protein
VLGPITVSIQQSGHLFEIRQNKCASLMILKPGHTCAVAFAASANAAGARRRVIVGAANAVDQTAVL